MIVSCILVEEIAQLESAVVGAEKLVVDQEKFHVLVPNEYVMEMAIIVSRHHLLRDNLLKFITNLLSQNGLSRFPAYFVSLGVLFLAVLGHFLKKQKHLPDTSLVRIALGLVLCKIFEYLNHLGQLVHNVNHLLLSNIFHSRGEPFNKILYAIVLVRVVNVRVKVILRQYFDHLVLYSFIGKFS